jgi:segregation and condensation protein B
VRIVGRRDAPGRPALYGTSATFLETFGLRGLTDLPALREIQAIVAAPAEEIPSDEGALEAEAGEPLEPSDSPVFPDDEESLGEVEATALRLH